MAEILPSDAASYVDATQMDTALADLHRQQGKVDAVIVQVEVRKRSTKSGAWGWIILVVLHGMVAILAV